jgi:hypothetical protein
MTQRLQVIVESESTEAGRAAVADVFEVVSIPPGCPGSLHPGTFFSWLIQIEAICNMHFT